MLQQSKWIINNFFKEIKKINKNSVILHIYHEEKKQDLLLKLHFFILL